MCRISDSTTPWYSNINIWERIESRWAQTGSRGTCSEGNWGIIWYAGISYPCFSTYKCLDTYDNEQLVCLLMRAIFSSIEASDVHATPLQMYAGLRDRAMILLSSSIAFRGDSARSLLWSDLELRNIPMINIGLDAKVPASNLVILSTFLLVLMSYLSHLGCRVPGWPR